MFIHHHRSLFSSRFVHPIVVPHDIRVWQIMVLEYSFRFILRIVIRWLDDYTFKLYRWRTYWVLMLLCNTLNTLMTKNCIEMRPFCVLELGFHKSDGIKYESMCTLIEMTEILSMLLIDCMYACFLSLLWLHGMYVVYNIT